MTNACAAIAGVVGGTWLEMVSTAKPQATNPDRANADLVVFNAKVHTVDPRAPKAEAFSVKSGRFVAVGSNADIKGLIAKGIQTFDAMQMTVVPGQIAQH